MYRKIFVISLLVILIALASSSICFAEPTDDNTLTAEILNLNQDTVYHVFDDPSDIEYSESGSLYIRCGSGYEVFDGTNFILSDIDADSIAALSGGIATLKGGKLSYGNSTPSGDFSVISAYQNTLYAASGKTIYKFTGENGELVPDESGTVTAVSDVKMLAAAENGCMYAVSRAGGYTDVYFNGEQIPLSEKVIDLSFCDGKYYILTESNIRMYTELYLAPVTQSAEPGAISICAGNGIYLLCRTGTVARYTSDLSRRDIIIASSGELDWFYTTPVNVDTKLGNILVTDKNLGTSTGLGRISVISDDKIDYIGEINTPVAATADNRGKTYIAHSGNKVSVYEGGEMIDEIRVGTTQLTDIEIDFDGNLYCLDKNGDVLNAQGTAIRHNVKAMKFHSVMHYMTDGYVDDQPLQATDFAFDVVGNIFAVSGNKIIAIVDGEQKEYVVSNASELISIAISKVETNYVSYGDLIMIDKNNMCLMTLDGKSVGSVNAKELFTAPELNGDANSQAEGLIAKTDGTLVFALPIEGEIVYEAKQGEHVILLREGNAPDPYVYCAVDATDENGKPKLITGYVYRSTIAVLDYHAPRYYEAKVNANNTPIYKYPSVNSPVLTEYSKNTMVAILPFAATFPDEIAEDDLYADVWYKDAYGDTWYRIAYGKGEGFIISTNTDTNLFSNEIEMPQPNATINADAKLYRYDEVTDTYVELSGADKTVLKDTRVRVPVPYGSSNDFTQIVFYREGLGVIDADCFVETKYIDFDGVDVVQIIAICVIVLAVIALIIVIIRRLKYRRLNRSRAPELDNNDRMR